MSGRKCADCGTELPKQYGPGAPKFLCDACAAKREAARLRNFKRERRRQDSETREPFGMNPETGEQVFESHGDKQPHATSHEYTDSLQSGKTDFISPFDEAERWARGVRGRRE